MPEGAYMDNLDRSQIAKFAQTCADYHAAALAHAPNELELYGNLRRQRAEIDGYLLLMPAAAQLAVKSFDGNVASDMKVWALRCVEPLQRWVRDGCPVSTAVEQTAPPARIRALARRAWGKNIGEDVQPLRDFLAGVGTKRQQFDAFRSMKSTVSKAEASRVIGCDKSQLSRKTRPATK